MILDDAVQQRHRLVERPGLQIQPAEQEIEADVEPLSACLLERGNRAGRIGGRIVARPHEQPSLAEFRVDRAENPIRFLIGRVAREGGLRVRDGVDGVVLTRVETRQLGAQLGRTGVERDGALVDLDGLFDLARAFEVSPEQIVVAGVPLLDCRRGRLPRARRHHGDKNEHAQSKKGRISLTIMTSAGRRTQTALV